MVYLTRCFFLFATLCCMTLTVTASNVISLSDKDFLSKVSDYSVAVVKFHVPWCGHCKNLAPEFEKAGKLLKKSGSEITLFEVDCSENGKTMCSMFKVKSYPTLKIFKYGQLASDYSGPKHAEGIFQHLKSTLLPGSKELKTLEDAGAFLNSEENCVFGFFEPTKTNIESEFHRMANSMKDQYRFGHTYHQRVLSRFGYRNEIVLMRAQHLQNRLEPPHVKYEGEVTLYKLRSWITEHYHGLVGIRTLANIDDFRRPLVVVYYKLDFKGKNAKESSYWRNRVMLLARKYEAPGSRKVHFAVSDASEFHRELSELGLNSSGNQPVASARDTQERRYVMSNPFSIENLEQFVEDLLSGSVNPYVKSAPVPQPNEGPVKLVVGANFHEIVTSATSHVLIYFHSPWCGECPELDKTFEKLATKMSSSGIVFASMDATKNDVPKQFVIKRFPAIFLVRNDIKMKPSLYEGKYEASDLVKFLADIDAEGRDRDTMAVNDEAPRQIPTVKSEL